MPEGESFTSGILLKPGTLWQKVVDRTSHALQCGALLTIPTDYEFVEQNGVKFLVRILSNLDRKYQAKKKQDRDTATGKDFNPFLPYEEDLFVADISDTHVCILNKFNVVDYHLLIVTRAFESQESLLTLPDFAAMWAVLNEFEGLAFYNAGKNAGASQRHKHLQVAPLPLAPKGAQIPIEPLLASAKFEDSVGTIPELPFKNAIARLNPQVASPLKAAQVTFECYYNLLQTLGLLGENGQVGAYNLLATPQWMLIVPRSQESFEAIAVNSLGFAGTLLVRNAQQMQLIKDLRPLNVLTNVAISA
ncbi:MAG TPA: phosphorylase [Leptolyngbyaceae cyanobacterium]